MTYKKKFNQNPDREINAQIIEREYERLRGKGNCGDFRVHTHIYTIVDVRDT